MTVRLSLRPLSPRRPLRVVGYRRPSPLFWPLVWFVLGAICCVAWVGR